MMWLLLFLLVAVLVGLAILYSEVRRLKSAGFVSGALPILNKLEVLDAAQKQIDGSVRSEMARNREEHSVHAREGRKEIADSLKLATDGIVGQISRLTDANQNNLQLVQTTTAEKLEQIHVALSQGTKSVREDTLSALKNFNDSVLKQLVDMTVLHKQQAEEIRTSVDNKLNSIQSANETKLEQMRQTVDERLQGTLEARLGESFRLVSERLEQVHKGLGEMQTLASSVGDLRKVFANVKTRGTWGEVQLGALLEQILTPEQYETNVSTTGSPERVEFAIKLPGRDEDGLCVYLPIDAKFPLEDYQRLVEATERGDMDGIDAASRQLENTLKICARTISQKYVAPPATTDFGILFLSTESLYAEALRRPGLADTLQRDFRVVIAGPSTLAALLNSLQMGFRTLQIQRRSGEVWQILGSVKSEFIKYGDVLDKVKKKLTEASNTVDQAATRTRQIERKLRKVETENPETQMPPQRFLLQLTPPEEEVAEMVTEEDS